MRVLIVDDEEDLAVAIRAGLRRESIAADVALDGSEAMQRLAENDYDVVLLDRDLPGVHGDDVARHIVDSGRPTRILMLTAARQLDARVNGLALGADDYLTKPFAFTELVARTRALARRVGPAVAPVLRDGGLSLDSFRHEVFRDGKYVGLTPKEFAVLEVLMRAAGGTVSAERLLEQAWDENADPFTNAIKVTISTLRRKLGLPWAIETVPGVGYRVPGAGRA